MPREPMRLTIFDLDGRLWAADASPHHMDDPLTPELELAAALRMTADPPQAWIDAAAMLPSTLGELDEIERLVASPEFRDAFESDPERALADFGLPASPLVVTALRERLFVS